MPIFSSLLWETFVATYAADENPDLSINPSIQQIGGGRFTMCRANFVSRGSHSVLFSRRLYKIKGKYITLSFASFPAVGPTSMSQYDDSS